MSMLRWTHKSTLAIAEELTRQGHPVSDETLRQRLRRMGYTLQVNVKTWEVGWAAEIFDELQRPKEALECRRKALEESDPRSRISLALTLAEQGARDEALAALDPLMKEDVTLRAVSARAAVLDIAGRGAEAEGLVAKHLEARPDSAVLLGSRARLLRRRGELAKALEDFDRVVAKPWRWKARYPRALTLLAMGRQDEAAKELEGLAKRAEEPSLDRLELWMQRDEYFRWRYLALALAGRKEEAAALAKAHLATARSLAWSRELSRALVGEVGAEALLRGADHPAKTAQARFWLGMRARLGGAADEAAAHLEACVKAGAPATVEHELAELIRTGKALTK
jgi:tetratricopeptide (TPR) repeat protein